MSLSTRYADFEPLAQAGEYAWTPSVDPRVARLRTLMMAGAALTVLALLASNVYLLSFYGGWKQGAVVPVDLEHGLIEMSQLVLMVPAIALFAMSWRQGAGAVKVAGGLLALLTLAAFIRECEIDSLGVHFGFLGITERNLPDILLIVIAGVTLAYLAANVRLTLDLFALALRRHSWPFYAAALLMAISLLLDGWLSTGRETRFWEEFSEYNAYALLLLAAWRHAGLIGAVALRSRRARCAI